ncbi:MAG: hypothetical protein IPM29_04085 [Planctomycetes bacterium]|nr:hypothetical protein [Planctomycetota bacterium]
MLRTTKLLGPVLLLVTLPTLRAQNAGELVRAPEGVPVAKTDELWANLADVPGVRREGGMVVLAGLSGCRFQVIDFAGGDFVIWTPLGRTLIDLWRLEDGGSPTLLLWLGRARAAGATEVDALNLSNLANRARFWSTPLVGDTFGTDEGFVETRPGGRIWRRVDAPAAPDAKSLRYEVWMEASRAAGGLESAIRGDRRLKSVQGVLAGLVEMPDDDKERALLPPNLLMAPSVDMRPDVLRRLVRHGWLHRALGDAAAADAVRDAVLDAETLRVDRAYETSDGGRLEHLTDAFGREAWRRTERRGGSGANGIAVLHPEPWHLSIWSNLSKAWLEYQLPVGVDPFAPGAVRAAMSVDLRLWGRSFASWRPGRFEADGARWADWMSETDSDAHPNALANALPPHIVLLGPDADLHGLAVSTGLLRTSTGVSDADRFLSDAARLLSEVRTLELLGQYLWAYAFDSPDPARPELIGTEVYCGDQQNSALDTVGAACGGELRGDCDDLTALYIDILRRQGRFAVPMGTPEHVSALWVESGSDGVTAWIAQTGPTLEFKAPTLAEALALAYRSEDATRPFDPQSILGYYRLAPDDPVMDVLLPLEAFGDLALANDVVERAKLAYWGAAGAAHAAAEHAVTQWPDVLEPLTYRSGLHEAIGDFAGAAADSTRVLERATEQATRAHARAARLRAFALAGDLPRAGRDLDRLLAIDLSAFAVDEKPLVRGRFLLDVADALGSREETAELFARVVDAALVPALAPVLDELWRRRSDLTPDGGDGTGDARDSGAFGDDYGDEQLIDHAGRLLRCAIQVVDREGERRAGFPAEVDALGERYARIVAADPELGSAYRWESVGNVALLLARRGRATELRTPAAAIEWPGEVTQLTTAFDGDAGRVWQSTFLRWALVSPFYWVAELDTLLGRSERPDRAEVERLLAGLDRAVELCDPRGELDPLSETVARIGRLAATALLGDLDRFRALLGDVKSRGDVYEYGAVRETLAQLARHVDAPRWRPLVASWLDVVGHRPSVWWQPWRMVQAGLPDHAEVAGQLAAERSRGDDRFTLEPAALREAIARLRAAPGRSAERR